MIFRFTLMLTALVFAVALAAGPSLVLAGDDSYSAPPDTSEGTYSEPPISEDAAPAPVESQPAPEPNDAGEQAAPDDQAPPPDAPQ